MSGYLPDGCTQADCDRAAEGDRCRKSNHGELNMDGTCDWCEDEWRVRDIGDSYCALCCGRVSELFQHE